MATASGANHSVYDIAESEYGVVPSTPAWEFIRQIGCSLAPTVDVVQSQEYVNRRVMDSEPGMIKAAGNLEMELSYGSHDDQIEAVLMGTWARTGTKTATTISAAAEDNSLNDSADGFITAGFRTGDVVSIAGFTKTANNTTRATIATLTKSKMTFTGAYGDGIVDEAATPSVTINSLIYRVKDGSTRRSRSIMRKFGDISKYLVFGGGEYDKWDLNVSSPDGSPIVTGTFGIIAQSVAYAEPASSTYGSRSTSSPFTSIRGTLKIGGVASAIVTEWGFSIANGLTLQPFVGSQITGKPVSIQSTVTGNLTTHFEDVSNMQSMIAGTATSFEHEMQDAAGNKLKFVFPKIKLTGAPLDVKGGAPIAQALSFTAHQDTTTDAVVYIERTPAA
jgi:hypothetical protein